MFPVASISAKPHRASFGFIGVHLRPSAANFILAEKNWPPMDALESTEFLGLM
jgi:hypothetical protein